MRHRYQDPHPALSPYVRTVLILEGAFEPDPSALPLFTSGMHTLYCRTEKQEDGTEQVRELFLIGKPAPEGYWAVKDNTTVVAFFFKPFALACLFAVPATQLTEAPVDLRACNPHISNAIITQLAYAGTTDRKVEVLGHLVRHQLEHQERECEIIRYATDRILCHPATDVLAEILETLGLKERTFQRIFKKYVGVTPGQYRRICQFHGSFTQVKSGEFDKLGDVAFDHGFADQSHFIRTFREFTETTPHHYLKRGLKGKGPDLE